MEAKKSERLFRDEVYIILEQTPAQVEEKRKEGVDEAIAYILGDTDFMSKIRTIDKRLYIFERNCGWWELYLEEGKMFLEWRDYKEHEIPFFPGEYRLDYALRLKAQIELYPNGKPFIDFDRVKFKEEKNENGHELNVPSDVRKKYQGKVMPSNILPSHFTKQKILGGLEKIVSKIVKERRAQE